MNIEERTAAFSGLGSVIGDYLDQNLTGDYKRVLDDAVYRAEVFNPWFTKDFIRLALGSVARNLTHDNLQNFVSGYSFGNTPRKIAVIMAGNLPLVGFHDFLSVLISGNIFLGKLSSKDKFLLPALAGILMDIDSGFKEKIVFEEEILKGFDAVIATGSNNSGRYFDYYFGRYPSVIRRNRNSVAVIGSGDGEDVFSAVASDAMYYFGLGCRSVSKLYVPQGFDFVPFLDAFENFGNLAENTKYFNNYEYNKSVFLINGIPHLDTGFLLLKEDESLASPIAVLHYEYYDDIDVLNRKLMTMQNRLQCVVSSKAPEKGFVKPGTTQFPALDDWADGVDILDFLSSLQ